VIGMSNRSGNPSLATAEEPTPEPSSAVMEIPENLRNDLFVQYMMDPPAEYIANLDADEVYGEDHARALAGQHPLQRSRAAAR
jgi:hypothetical protein